MKRKEAEERDLLELLCCPVCGEKVGTSGGNNDGIMFRCVKCGELVRVVEPSWVRRKINGMVDGCRRLSENIRSANAKEDVEKGLQEDVCECGNEKCQGACCWE